MKLFKPVKTTLSEHEIYLMILDNEYFVEFHDLDCNPIPLDKMSIDKIYNLIQWQDAWDQANI